MRHTGTRVGPDESDPPADTSGEERFRALYPGLRRFAAVVAPPDVDPDDLVQDALVGLLSRSSLDAVDDLRAYLHRSVVNVAANRRRRWTTEGRANARHGKVATTSVPSYPSDLSDLLRLPPRERGALYLHAVDGRPFDEVGRLLGCSEAAARKASSRARRRLGDDPAIREER